MTYLKELIGCELFDYNVVALIPISTLILYLCSVFVNHNMFVSVFITIILFSASSLSLLEIKHFWVFVMKLIAICFYQHAFFLDTINFCYAWSVKSYMTYVFSFFNSW